MGSLAEKRLMAERKKFRRDHPHGFWARPMRGPTGMNIMKWEAGIPGKKGSLWEGGIYKVVMEFPEEYPAKPPKVRFPKGLFHPNVYPSGTVCLSLLSEEKDWKPSITVKQILLGIQNLLDSPNPKDPAQREPYELFVQNRTEYNRRVKLAASDNRPV